MGASLILTGVLGGLGVGTSLFGLEQEREARERAASLRLQQEEAQNTMRETQNTRRLNEVLASQIAREGASGLSVDSPSFTSIQADDFNKWASDINADNLALNFDELSKAETDRSANISFAAGLGSEALSIGSFVHNASFESTRAIPSVQTLQQTGQQELATPLPSALTPQEALDRSQFAPFTPDFIL